MRIEVSLSGKLGDRLLNLHIQVHKIILKDLQTAAANRLAVMERIQIEK
jgi:hypothetical protein